MKVVLEQFQFLGDSRGGGAGASAAAPAGEYDQTPSPERHAPPPRNAGAKPAAGETLDDDVPF
jgi:hypothetical protein